MPTRHCIQVRVPIPAALSPALVIETLQTFDPLLDNHHYIVDYRPKSGPISEKDLAVIKGDAFFRDDCDDLLPRNVSPASASDSPGIATNNPSTRWSLYDIWEDVYWVPYLVPYFSRLKRYLAVGCRTESGIRFRLRVCCGVVTRGAFTVVARGTGRPYCHVQPREQGQENHDVEGDDDTWDGDTEKGTIAESDAEISPETADERETENKDEEDEDTDIEPEPTTWDLVCDCEIQMPLIMLLSQWCMRGANRELCEHLCRSIIQVAIAEGSTESL
jgi:hypothetical protein